MQETLYFATGEQTIKNRFLFYIHGKRYINECMIY